MSEELIAKEKTSVLEQENSPSRWWRTLFSSLMLLSWLILMLLVWVVLRLFMPQKLESAYMLFHRGCCWAFGINCQVIGELSNHRPTLFLANHISYLDVFVYGSVIPVFFIAKSEVASWPILGWLAKIQNTLFFERNSRKVHGQLKVMSEHFDRGGNLILFPEGTSTEGQHVEPFKSSLLQAVEKAEVDVLIQPVTIAYTQYRGKAMNQSIRNHYAWYGDMEFAAHFFSALGLGQSQVVVQFHPPVELNDFSCRKDCANLCHQQVSDSLEVLLDQPTSSANN